MVMMRVKHLLNQEWRFKLGKLDEPNKLVKKAASIGGLTAPLVDEAGDIVAVGAGGEHFLKLIAQGNRNKGLEMLAGTQLNAELTSKWDTINLPHDWKSRQPFINDPSLLMSGSKQNGQGYYRKTFEVDRSADDDTQVFLHFMGVMGEASIWLNGIFLGNHYSGYSDFSFDITEIVKYHEEGINVVLVKTDTTVGSEGWWYEGAGIYKDVYLEFLPRIRIDAPETFVETDSIENGQARLKIVVGIMNQSGNDRKKTRLLCTINNHTECFDLRPQKSSSTKITYTQVIDDPDLWSINTPNLYQARFQLLLEDKVIDDFQQTFGVRLISYSSNGFYMNKKRVELRGVCEHQDFGGVGIAVNKDILRYKLLKMKKMGVNAYRSSHHFASLDLLDLCDELGIIVMNENRILESSEWRVAELEQMVKQTRNHPSICFWSLCNEELIGNTVLGERIARKLTSVIRRYTTQSLIVSAELLSPKGIVNEAYMNHFDVNGVNYPEAEVNGNGLVMLKKKYPNLFFLSTENASYFSTRGIYRDNAEKCQTSNFGSSFSRVLPGKRKKGDPGVGGTAHPETVMHFIKNNSFMGGVFLWTFMDYFGEPSPFAWPGISSQFGIVDTVGFEKDYYYYYQSQWTSKPMVHVMPHWNREGLSIDKDGLTEVRVFTNCPEVELFINDQSFGRKLSGEDYTSWYVPYITGQLKAVGYSSNKPVEDLRTTSGKAKSTRVRLCYDGISTALYEVDAIDATGHIVPTANNNVRIKIMDGIFLGSANGNPMDISKFNPEEKRFFSGKLMVIVEKNCQKQPKVVAKITEDVQ
ncbi:Beta-galactosidase BoGH2A (plasmid) [Lactiplantibacillus plantarum]|nr:Beta-galactosidase BoGH2A [Lactiplantibacillus plantarum]